MVQIRDTRPTTAVVTQMPKKSGSVQSSFDHVVKDEEIKDTPPSIDFKNISLNTIDPLFLSLDQGKSSTKQAIERAHKILDELTSLQKGFLTGAISKDNIEKLISFSKNMQQKNIPDHLKDILQEIETRAAVELAKIKKISH